MATVPTLRQKNAAYQSNVNKRGHVKTSLKPKNKFKIPITYWAMALIAFTFLGGALVQVLNLIV
ncbi:hypothetical protein J3Q64DRAFT_1735975 [Phycomyces blakesleeanus]|uniref:Stress-associated endoplasmic reticulum protein n=1 Tax=Phycomyces blakesleeanus TaxID=4837 RepID=A0ABR3B0D3_PHYBL